MKLYLVNHEYKYAVEQIMLTMFPGERPEYPERPTLCDHVVSTLFLAGQFATARCDLHYGGECHTKSARIRTADIKDPHRRDSALQRVVKLSFYRAALEAVGKKPVWGSHTGIRPGKVVSDYIESGMSPAAAARRLQKDYDVSQRRAELCLDTAEVSLREKKSLLPGDICLYVGIPFCPTRCAYCSFVSLSVEKSMGLIPRFLDALEMDINVTAEVVRRKGLRPVSLYIGGGTPTTLSAPELHRLCEKLKEDFDLGSLREYTVEAGRPETISAEKLKVLYDHGVTRLSVNPQTMDDRVLELIGRKHTSYQVLEALELVREAGNFAVNMDLIAGLPGDSRKGFEKTLKTVLSLRPENITVHTLALKKGSKILTGNIPVPNGEEVGKMLDCAMQELRAWEYAPYYLYRQKFTSGGFENVGWCKNGFQSLYNVCIMEELCSIISMGGGASTKLVTGDGRIERIFAPKYPKEYIEGISKIKREKEKIEVFYDGIRAQGNK